LIQILSREGGSTNVRQNLAVVGSILFLSLSSACSGIYARGDAGYSLFNVKGDVALSPSPGLPLDNFRVGVEEDLGLDDAAGSPFGKLEVGLGICSVTVSAFEYDESASGRLSRNFGTLPVGADIATDARILNAKGAVLFELLDIGGLKLSPGIGVDYFDMDLAVSSSGASESVDAEAPVPMVFAQGELDIGPASFVVEGGYMEAHLEDAKGRFWDLEAIARIHLGKTLHVFGGYRYIDIAAKGEADGQPFDTNLEMRGWMLGGGFRF
jgi:hypothetical protein